MCALPFGQRVLVADAGHQVSEARDPGTSFIRVGRNQIQGLHVVAMVDGEAARRVQAALGMPMEDV